MKKYIKIYGILICFLIFFLTISFSHAQQRNKQIFISSYNSNFLTFFSEIQETKTILKDDKCFLGLKSIDMKKFLIDDNSHNPNMKINKKFSFYKAYRTIVLTASVVFVVMFSLIIWLIINIQRRKKAEMRLINRNDELTSLYEKLYTSEEEIRKLAYYDSLTNLPNRILLNRVLKNEIRNAKASKISGTILFIDIDNFKVINDTFGHSLGDKLLIKVSDRFKSLIDGNNLVARLGGDEFLLILRHIDTREEIDILSRNITNIFEKPFWIEEKEFYLTLSMGIVFYPKDGDNVTELLKNADTAMYKAKALGKNQYVYFEKEMNEQLFRKIQLQNKLRNALSNNEFILLYQPKVNLKNDEIVGYEALIRWISPDYGFISPNEFINIAEENGLIFKIGTWVFEEACEFSKKINKYSHKNINVSVNVSAVELINSDFISNIKKILEKTGINPKLIGIEITETVLMKSFHASKLILNELMKLGIQISLDDFGTGYSSLNYLRKLPIDILKIDKSFVNDIESDKGAKILIKSIIQIAHNLNLKIVAEGVETLEQKNTLKKYGCDQIQGYLIDTPISEEEILEKLIASS